MTPELLDQFRKQVRSNPQSIAEAIDTIKAPDAAELINELPLEEAVMLFLMLPVEESVAILNEPSCERRHTILESIEVERAAEIFTQISSDERAYIIRRMNQLARERITPFLPPDIIKNIRFLLQFPPTSAGGIMTTEFVHLQPDMTVAEALDQIRLASRQRMTVYSAYVVDNNSHLLGAVSLRDLVCADPQKMVRAVMRKYPISVNCLDDQEKVARILAKYNLLAVPVTDDAGRVVGFVTVDDALDVLVEEQTEDVYKLAGVEAMDDAYMSVPLLSMVKKRAVWLVVLFVGEMLTATAMGYFEGEIAKAVVLALFVPLIISSGGNTGSQAATLIIRALALGEAEMSDWWRVLHREIISGLILGAVLGGIGFLRIAIWSLFSTIYGPHWFYIALTVFFSLIGVVLWGTISGSMLPFMLKKLGLDPATSSAPFVATLVDVTGLIIYFSVALVVLRGKLL
ncbi:MAG: magnesium transporter [Blastocatellia bacterium]|nr:magnesium transporter [Blastocatellia bacterium]